jgi:DNA repair exonuclease SbcCD ATPase subunit
MNQMNKSNVTLWKNRDTSQGISQNQPKKKEDSKQVENEFIENLKKQIYFMEMELKLMKERENEIAKSGGFTQLFNDERDPSQHIQQLKTKYANMRKKMEDQIATLNDKKREVTGLNVALKAKLETLQKLERDVYMKLQNSQEKGNNKLNNLTSNYLEKNNERNELEANNRLQNTQLGSEIKRNEELEYNILSGEKNDELDKIEFESQIKLLEDMTTEKTKSYDETNNKIKELNTKTNEEPYFKTEIEKNEGYKKKIEELEKLVCELNTQVEGMELVNDYYVKKKQNVVNERKKYVDLNVELRHEIDSKNQLNEIRIQKKVKEANSEEIQNLNNHLNETNEKIKDLEDKIQKELEKIKNFNNDIIKNNIELKHKEEKKDELMETIDKRIKESTELKEKAEELNRNNEELKQKIGKEQTDNELIRNRNKLLAEEYSALQSKYDFIKANYDYTTNLKKIKVDDLKNLTQTNNLVNSTIDTFVDKIGSFKKANIQNLMSIDDE